MGIPPRDRGPVFASIVVVCVLVVLAAYADTLWPRANRSTWARVDLTSVSP